MSKPKLLCDGCRQPAVCSLVKSPFSGHVLRLCDGCRDRLLKTQRGEFDE